MSIMSNFDKVSPIHRLVFDVRKSAKLRARWKEDFSSLTQEYGLSEEETRAVRECDLKALSALGIHPFYYNPIIRLTHGEDYDDYHPRASECMKRAYGAVGDPKTYGLRDA